MKAKIATQKTKQELLSSIIETCAAILQEASQLSFIAQDTVFLGVWSVKSVKI